MIDAPRATALPTPAQSAAYVAELGKPTAAEVLRDARAAGHLALQPRCGVGSHRQMTTLLQDIERHAAPDVLSVTIDAHTRLGRFGHARTVLDRNPADLNGYPLVAHGWRRGRELNEAVRAPLEIRHGSPDARVLFGTAVASGITSFEGGGISYNLPYSKDVPLERSLAAWRTVDAACGKLADHGLVIDRELFGTLTAVLMPPSVSLAVSVLEAVAAAREGVRCISVAYPQGGHTEQDVAALRAVPLLAERYLPAGVEVHAVLHEFMGVFPRERAHAEDLILYGALVARHGGATKLITKTYQEAYGIPDTRAIVDGLHLAARANSPLLGAMTPDEGRVAEELEWVVREVDELVAPVLAAEPAHGGLHAAIAAAFAHGTLDIPFSASRHARSELIPGRADDGAVRILEPGSLPLSPASRERHRAALKGRPTDLYTVLTRDINYFPLLFGEDIRRGPAAPPVHAEGSASSPYL
ncbi:methylaspartate mutase [Streptomyces sp. B1I3]|uniref:methylaspartate mutase n=1 Tax=Streptomyces sp. B1I3 TaxID=3042264 RepID=UPI00278B6A17|nr:methylaspartate mutase [Streptomyces sp. B1I3]MDQ0795637.1 methylaspartate mutase epsilon subunit [Streptomyces sp. B1I3]